MKLKDKIKIINRQFIKDSRGYFLKVLNGTEEGLTTKIGEVYVTMAKPNESRGGHYHKLATEYFTLIEGRSILFLEDVRTNESMIINIDSESPITVVIQPYIAHIFKNISNIEFILVAYSDIIYDPKDTIAYNIKESPTL